MNIGFYHQLLAELIRAAHGFVLPRPLRDMVKLEGLEDMSILEDSLLQELREPGNQGVKEAEYLSLIGDVALRFTFFRKDFARFAEVADLLEKWMDAMRGGGAQRGVQLRPLVAFLNETLARIQRKTNVEHFERVLDELEWGDFDRRSTATVCMAIGMVYMNELAPSRRTKSRFWLQRAVDDADFIGSWTAMSLLGQFYLQHVSPDNLKRLDDLINHATTASNHPDCKHLSNSCKHFLIELRVRKALADAIQAARIGGDEKGILESNFLQLREWTSGIQREVSRQSPLFDSYLKMLLGEGYLNLAEEIKVPELRKRILLHASNELSEAVKLAQTAHDVNHVGKLKHLLLKVQVLQAGKQVEKDLKEAMAEARKTGDLAGILQLSLLAARHFGSQKDGAFKAYEALMDGMRRGLKRLDDGGFVVVVGCMEAIHQLLGQQIKRPGISWVVSELDSYFALLCEAIESLEKRLETIGVEQFDYFQAAYLTLGPVTHHQIKVYLHYQFQAIRVLRLSTMIREDIQGSKVADNLLSALSCSQNPLSFIRGDWEDFKDVPFEVRNKVVNKCISITKGDLPEAAKHLDFSYRNLRSYITFEEVNRLGFFLEEQQTNNRQLEQGIRLIFHDLYKSGTIFEVVFDMPKFLVDHAKTGFSSQDMEEVLEIKGTTAKKYIKIMMEAGMVDLDHNEGRKLFYRVRKDNIMTRLGKEQKVI